MPHPRLKKWFRRTAWTILFLVVLMLVFVLIIQMPWGKNAVVNLVAGMVSGRMNGSIEIGRVTGGFPFYMRIDTIRINDAEGAWLDIDDFALNMSSAALWRKRVHIEVIRIAQLTLHRRPVRDEPPPLRIPNLPNLPEWLRIDELAIPRVTIEKAVVGAAAELALEGHFLPPKGDRRWDIEFQLDRVDGEGTHALIDADATVDQLRLVVDVRDDGVLPEMLGSEGPVTFRLEGDGPRAEWRGTLTGRIADRDVVTGTLDLGAREDTDIALSATANLDHPIVPAQIAERFGDNGEARIEGTLMSEGLLSLHSLHAVTPQATVNASGSIHLRQSHLDLTIAASHRDPARLLQQDPASIPPASIDVSLSGSLDDLDVTLESALGDARVVKTAANLDVSQGVHAVGDAEIWPHESLVPEPFAARLSDGLHAAFDVARDPEGRIAIEQFDVSGAGATVTAEGAMDPVSGVVDARLQAELERIQTVLQDEALPFDGAISASIALQGDGSSTNFEAGLNARDVSVPDGALPRLSLSIDGAWKGGIDAIEDATAAVHLESAEGTYASNPVPPIQLDARLAAPQPNMLVVEELFATDGQSKLLVSGTYDTDRAEARMNATLAAPLAPYQAWLGQEIAGNVNAAAEVTKSAEAPWAVGLNGELAQLTGIPSVVQALVGERATLATRGTVDGAEIELTSLAIEGAHLAIDGQGSFDTENKALALDANASIPNLGAIGEALDTELAGALQLNARASGTIDAPVFDGHLTIKDPTLGPLEGRHAEASFAYEHDADTPRVTLAAQLDPRAEGAPLELDAQAMLESDRVRVPSITLSQAENRVTGNLTYITESNRAAAQLTIEAPDLASLAVLTAADVQGQARGTVRVTTEGRADAEIVADNLQWGSILLGHGEVGFTANEVYDSPNGVLSATLTRVVTPTAAFERAAIDAQGDSERVTIAADTAGELQNEAPFAFETAAEVSIDDRRVELSRLRGALGEYPVVLQSPTSVAALEEGWRVESVVLAVGDGQIRAQGLIQPESINVQTAAENLPLAMLQLAGGPEVEGIATGNLTITGTGPDPRGQLELHLADIRRPGGQPDTPPADVQVAANISSNALDGTIAITAGELLNAQGNAAIPMTWRVVPWEFDIAEEAPLQGSFEAQGDLAALPAFLVLPEHKIEGRIDAQLALRGTRGAPDVAGEAHLRDGRYENVETGTILSNVQADLRGENYTLQLERLEAAAGPDGAVSAQGHVAFPRGEPLSIDTSINLRNARVVHRDDATARATGDLRFHGTPSELWVDGDIQAGPADIALPEPAAEKVPDLEVTEVNLPKERAEELAEEAEEEQDPGVVNLKFHVTAPGRVYVRGRGLDSEWRGDLTVTGTANDPRLDGSLGIVRGHMTVLGRRFEFENSTIAFNGSEPPNPYLNLNTVADAGDVTARLAMSGTLDTLELALSSEPPLPRDEILARVLFGKSLAQISALQAVQLAHAAATLTGNVEGLSFLSGAARLGVFDRIELRQGESLEESALGVGRYIGDDIYVEVEKGIGPESGNAKVEVELTPQISLEGEAGADRRQGVGLFWKKDY